MDNVLYIGPYREFSGMGHAARQYIEALCVAGYNVSIRPIYNYHISYPQNSFDQSFIDLEKNNSKHYHKIIQHCYPHQLVYDNRFDENIALIHLESTLNPLLKTNFSVVDKIIVGSSFVQKLLVDIGINQPIHIIPEPINLDKIIEYKNNNIIEKQDDNYKFYTISSFTDRKNLPLLLMCFLILSNYYENIDLTIKLRNIDNTSSAQNYIEYEFEKIYSTVRQNFIKKPRLYIGNTSYDNILNLHHNNECYINTSYGESFGFSALEAMCFNNNIIVTKNIGFDDIVIDGCGFKINSSLITTKDKDRIFPIYNSIYQKWYEPIMEEILNKMFLCINETNKSKINRINKQLEQIKNFTIESVANKLKNI